jgi:hypothetical protein
LETTTNRLFAAFARENTESANRGFLATSARPAKTKSLSVISASPQDASANAASSIMFRSRSFGYVIFNLDDA